MATSPLVRMRTCSPDWVRFFVMFLLGVACLVVPVPVALSTTLIDTTPTWDSVQGVGPFGDNGIETYGQTFVAPAESRLNHVTLFLNDELRSGTVFNPAYLDFKVYVMAWSAKKATGPVLFQSAKLTTTDNNGTGGMETFNVPIGGIDLIPGTSYVFFFSDSGLFDGNASTGAAGFLSEFAEGDVYSGGEFVSIDNQQDTSKWTSDTWDTFFPGKDLAFTLSFSAVPDYGAATSLFLVLFWGGMVLLKGRE
jgi:hypothetical protein